MTEPTTPQISAVGDLRLSNFWPQKPELWFVTAEAQFHHYRVTSDISKLDSEALSAVENVLTNPPELGKYEKLKETLLAHFAISEERRFKKLISGLHLGDRKLSALLKEMESLSRAQLDAGFLRTLWLQHLPSEIQVTLAAVTGLDNAALADLADRIHDIRSSNLAAVNQTFQTAQPMRADTGNTDTQVTLEVLAQQIDVLKVDVQRYRKHRSLSRDRSNNNTRLKSKDNGDSELCYYHAKFGKKARNCKKPCNWSNAGNESNRHW